MRSQSHWLLAAFFFSPGVIFISEKLGHHWYHHLSVRLRELIESCFLCIAWIKQRRPGSAAAGIISPEGKGHGAGGFLTALPVPYHSCVLKGRRDDRVPSGRMVISLFILRRLKPPAILPHPCRGFAVPGNTNTQRLIFVTIDKFALVK